jgi:tetratricopeptide (TPR) repeat protein
VTGPEGADEAEPSVIQNVTAVNGFAYGVIGADIHIFGRNGTPVYLLFAHHRVPNSDSRWQRAQPSRMLDARAEVVEFTGRETELAKLAAWRDDSRFDFAARWLHGEGGQGKTRLAARLAADSERIGWKVVDAVHGTETHPPASGSQDLRRDGAKGVLILIDYADRWPLTDLSWLFNNTLLNPGIPRRVLLIARSVFEWRSVSNTLHNLRKNIDASDQLLPSLPGDGPARGQMFAVARDCFARLYPEVAEPSAIGPPGPLGRGEFELTLAVHMAALVAVDAAACGRKPPADMLGLTVYLLDREYANWRQLYENADRGLDYRTPDRTMARTVFASVLTGAVTASTATKVLGIVMPEVPAGQVLTDHAICYPAGDPAMALAPMLPDRLAEDFLALMVPGHPITGFQPDDWAATAPEILLTSAVASSSGSRAVTFLASAADRWPHVGERVLYPLLRGKPDIAVGAGSAALAKVAVIGSEHDQIDSGLLSVLEAIDPLLPEGRHGDLDVGVLAIAERLIGYRLTTEADNAKRAWLLSTLGERRSNAGQWDRALEASEQATRLYRELAEADPRYRQHLVSSLVQLGGDLADLDRVSEAFTQTREAIAVRRELAEADSRHQPDLANALVSLSGDLAELGRLPEALAAAEEAASIFKGLANAVPDTYLPNLARALGTHGMMLVELGHMEAGLPPEEEAVRLFRQLAEADPGKYSTDLAAALTNLAKALLGLERHAEALTAAREATDRYRRLAKANPAAHQPNLVISLINCSAVLPTLGRIDEAVTAVEEAVAVSRQLAQDSPVAHQANLIKALGSYGDLLIETRRREDAIAALREATTLYATGPRGQHSLETPDGHLQRAYTRWLAQLAALLRETGGCGEEANALSALSGELNQQHKYDESVSAGRRAADLCAEAGDRAGEAVALVNLATALEDLGRVDEAIVACERAAAIFRERGDARLEAAALINLCAWLLSAERFDEVIVAAERSCSLIGSIGAEQRGQPFYYLGRAFLETGRTADAIAALRQAVAAYRSTGKGDHGHSGRPGLEADALQKLGIALWEASRYEEAIATCQRAADLYQLTGNSSAESGVLINLCAFLTRARKFEEAISTCKRLIARCQQAGDHKREAAAQANVGAALFESGRIEEAIEPCEQAAELARRTGDSDTETAALVNLGKILEKLGRHQEAVGPYKRAAQGLQQAGDPRELSVLRSLSGVSMLAHQFNDAIAALERMLAVAGQTDDHETERLAATSLGPVFNALSDQLTGEGQHAEAAVAVQRAAAAFHQVGDRLQEADALDKLNGVLMAGNRPDQAAAASAQAAAIFRELGERRGEAIALVHQGQALERLKRFAEVIPAAQRAARLLGDAGDRSGAGIAQYGLGIALSRLSRFNEAIVAYEQCAEHFRAADKRAGEGMALLALCHALREVSRLADGCYYGQRAAVLFGETGDQRRQAEALRYLSETLAAVGDTAKAEAAARKASAILRKLGSHE